MVPPSQTINAWIETNLFQDFATMPTGGNDSSAKQDIGGKPEMKKKIMKRRITRSMSQIKSPADTQKSIDETLDQVIDDDSSSNENKAKIYSEVKKDNFDIAVETNTEQLDDLEEQTAAAQVLQLLGLANVPDDSTPASSEDGNDTSDTGSRSDLDIVGSLVEAVLSQQTSVAGTMSETNHTYYNGPEWTSEEDELLKSGVNNFGYGKWEDIASTISGRTENQCKERWDIILSLNSGESNSLQEEEIEETLLGHPYFDTDWGEIAQKMTYADATDANVNISIDWSSVVDPTTILPVTMSNEDNHLNDVPSSTQSPNCKHSIDDDETEGFLNQETNETQQIGGSSNEGLSADLLITAMAENPQYFYQNDYSNVPYSAGPETFILSNESTNVTPRSVHSSENIDDTKNSRPAKRRKKSTTSDSDSGQNSLRTEQPLYTGYSCSHPQCNKTFARLYNLKSHQRTHSNDRPYKCVCCDAAFARNHDLKRHQKIHENAKPYKCLGCAKLFSRLDALRRHKHNPKSRELCRESEIAEA